MPKILIVEDDADIAAIERDYLEIEHFDVDIAADGVTGVQRGLSGGYDLKVIIEGDTLQEVAFFVARKLSTLDGVRSTKTHFILKTYKENDIVYVEESTDSREGVTA